MQTNSKFDFQGLDHVALTCSDMAATVDFYHRKLGMPVLHTIEYHDEAGQVVGQHWFFGVGDPANPNSHIAMFWWKDGYQTIPASGLPALSKPANHRATPVGQLLHLNLRVAPERIEEYCATLRHENIDFRHTVRYRDTQRPEVLRGVTKQNEFVALERGALMTSVYFSDPDGVLIEFNAWLPAWDAWRNDHVPMSQGSHV